MHRWTIGEEEGGSVIILPGQGYYFSPTWLDLQPDPLLITVSTASTVEEENISENIHL